MRSIIAWFVYNPVAANLLMLILVVGGLLTLPTLHQEEFPNIDTDIIQIKVPYLGAAPLEVEQSVCVRIEESIEGIEGIKSIVSSAAEGMCAVSAELLHDTNKTKAYSEIKSRVDGIDSFPLETEKPQVNELSILANVMQIVLAGEADERTLKILGQEMRDDLVELPGVSQVELAYVRPYEISIEISEFSLQRYGLSLDAVATTIRNSSLDIPGGSLKTEAGEILIRTKAQAYTGIQFEDIVLLTRADGANVLLSDVATVVDGFKDDDLRARFDGKPAVGIIVRRVGDEDVINIADQVKAYIIERRKTLPEGIELTIWKDESDDMVDRVGVLADNARSGFLLVLLVLTLFLRFRLALWVVLGIPVAVLGAVMMFPALDLTISTMSVLGGILVLGILVDDAIVVGERVYAHEQMGKNPIDAAIDGTCEVSVPVIFGVLTTIATFMPVMQIGSGMGPFFMAIATVVIVALIISLLESQLILPAHLAYHSAGKSYFDNSSFVQGWGKIQTQISDLFEALATDVYRPALLKALEWRYLTLSVAVGVVILVLALMLSGRIIFQFFPSMEGPRIFAEVNFPKGTALEKTQQAVQQIETAALMLQQELDRDRSEKQGSMFEHVFSLIGVGLPKGSINTAQTQGAHFAEVGILLDLPADYSGISTKTIASRWRELTGEIPDAVELRFSADSFSPGAPIDIQLRGSDFENLKAAAIRLKEALRGYNGVYDINDSFRAGKQEVQLTLLPEARNLGLTVEDLGRQVRQSFYGEEVQRVQRGKEDIRVMVRYPDNERHSLGDLENMRIRTSAGIEVPFASVADVKLRQGYSTIVREDGARIIRVITEVDRSVTTPEEILTSLQATVLPEIVRDLPGVSYHLAGEAEDQEDAVGSLFRNFLLALLGVYVLLAIPLRSYLQPLVIMSSIPFGAIGAIIGHYLLDADLVFFSLLGMVALSGVVVNSSLVLVDFINRQRDTGMPLMQAVSEAGVARFRPIVLTSLTTFVGLAPLINTPSVAVSFFMAMAISLAYGVLIATVVTLFLVPALYLILEDFLALLNRLQGKAKMDNVEVKILP